MTHFLINMFIKNKDDINNPKVRETYGLLSSIVGIVINIILFAFKLFIGTFSGSIAITSDAFNNLSDCGNSIITLVGYKLASKPADNEHPFGHGRMEYILSLILSIVIILVGYELFKNSVVNLFESNKVVFGFPAFFVLIGSILLKIWLSIFNKKLGNKISSDAMLAISKDAYNDVIATTATLLSLIFSQFTALPIDAVMGILVSCFILKTGYEIIKNSSSVLLGMKPDENIVNKIKGIINKNDEIIGYHDLMIHNYGPGRQFASCHVEFNQKLDFITAHDIIDNIEKIIEDETGVHMTLHMDPIDIENTTTKYFYDKIKNIIKKINDKNHIHDFRVIEESEYINIIFDLVIPYEFELKNEDILKILEEALADEDKKINLVLKIEHEYI